VDWLTVEREFLEVWNNSPETCKYRAMRNFQSRFRTLWLEAQWRSLCYRAVARLSTTYWAGRNVGLGQFLRPEVVEEVLGGRYDYGPGTNDNRSAKGHGRGSRATGRDAPLYLRLGGDIEPREGDPF
jgi:hypothetical protein